MSPNGPPQPELRNGQLTTAVVCASASGNGSTQVIRAATQFIGACGDGGRQIGRNLAGLGEGLI